MKNLKLLSNKFFFFLILFSVFFFNKLYSTETVDIWNLENKTNDKSFSQNSQDENSDEDEFEIPAFLRRQKN